MDKELKDFWLRVARGFALATLVFILGWYGRHWYAATHPHLASPLTEVRFNSSEYKFINPILYSNSNKENFPDLSGLSATLNNYVDMVTENKTADSVSIYFRDLNTGHWTGVNEDQKYQPASLLKVAILLAYLKHATDDSTFLDKQIYYQWATTTDQYYPPTQTLKTGYYSAEQLLEAMVVYSDNNAEVALLMADQTDFNNLLKAYQLPAMPVNTADYITSNFMSAKEYSTFFRTLYNGTYLPWGLSEQALGLLTLTNFNGGLVSGVASGTPVAHKFGERTSQLKDGTTLSRELHDCGIVYAKGHPYLLCVMTEGQNSTFPQLAGVISTASKLVYTYVTTND